MAREVLTGVYCIENLENHKKYYGSAVDMYERISEHKRDLRKGNHCNSPLQNSYNEYGEEKFSFKPFIIINYDDITEEEASNLSRCLEQTCMDFFDSYARRNGFNVARRTVGGNAEKFSEKDLKNGNCKIDEVQFEKLINLLQNDRISYAEIARQIGVDSWYVKQVATKKILTGLTEGISFPPRYNYGKMVREKYGEDIVNLREGGMSFTKIAEKFSLSRSIVEKVYHFNLNDDTGLSKEVFKFSFDGHFIKKYDSITQAGKDNKIDRKYIGRACARREGYGESGGFLWSYNNSLPELSMEEKILNKKLLPSQIKKLMVSYEGNQPQKLFENKTEMAKYYQITTDKIKWSMKNNKSVNRMLFKNRADVSEEDLEKLLKTIN